MKAKIADNIKTGRRGLPGGESTPASAPSSDTLDPVVRQPKYPCTECSSDAQMGFSAWLKGGNGTVVIRDDERLCLKCAKKRGIKFF